MYVHFISIKLKLKKIKKVVLATVWRRDLGRDRRSSQEAITVEEVRNNGGLYQDGPRIYMLEAQP